MKLSTYLSFNGNCEEAFEFYAKCFGVKIPMLMRYSDAPADAGDAAPEGCSTPTGDLKSKIMHTRIDVGGTMLMGSDNPPGRQTPISGVSVSVGTTDVEEGKGIFAALSEGGTVIMPYSETFWAQGFGMAIDKFGVQWMVNCERAM